MSPAATQSPWQQRWETFSCWVTRNHLKSTHAPSDSISNLHNLPCWEGKKSDFGCHAEIMAGCCATTATQWRRGRMSGWNGGGRVERWVREWKKGIHRQPFATVWHDESEKMKLNTHVEEEWVVKGTRGWHIFDRERWLWFGRCWHTLCCGLSNTGNGLLQFFFHILGFKKCKGRTVYIRRETWVWKMLLEAS